MSSVPRPGRAAVFAEILAGVAVAGLLLLAMVTSLDVLLRYVFASTIRGLADVTALAAAVLLAACLPHLVVRRGNIMIDFLGRLLGGRAHRGLNIFGAFVSFLFFAVMAWQCTLFALDMKSTHEAMPILRWPVWPWWSMVALFMVVTALVALATLLDEEAR